MHQTIKSSGIFPSIPLNKNYLQFWLKMKIFMQKNLNLLQINADISSRMEILSSLITRENPMNRQFDHKYDEIRWEQTVSTGQSFDKKSKQSVFTGLQPQTQTLSVFSQS